MNNPRIIHTRLYSKTAADILQSVEGQLSDGIWENSPAMEKYWCFSNVTVAPDGEVLIEIDSQEWHWDAKYRSQHNGFYDMPDGIIVKWFAKKVKQIMQIEMKDDGADIKHNWCRTNENYTTNYLNRDTDITVAEVYFVYDYLLGRNCERYYTIDRRSKLIGEPKSAEQIEAETLKRQKINEINTIIHNDRAAIELWKKTEMKRIEDEYRKRHCEIDEKYRAMKSELEVA